MIKDDQTRQIQKMQIISNNSAMTPSQSIDLATWSAEPFQPWLSAAMTWSCHTWRAIPRLPCTDLCRSLVGNAKRATLSNKGACHMMQKNMSVLSNHRSPKRFVPDLIWATSSPCARITDALPATSKYLVKARGPVGQDNPGWPKNWSSWCDQDVEFNAAGRHDSLPQTATLAIFNDAFPRSIIYLRGLA